MRSRGVTCEHKIHQKTGSDALCEADGRRPDESEACDLLCRQDCVVTLWAEWSVCDVTCEVGGATGRGGASGLTYDWFVSYI